MEARVEMTGAPEDVKNIPPNELPYYTTLSGTSMASPETAGVVALILEANPALTPAEVRMVLQITARSIPATPFFKQGYGYTDASGAVELAQSLKGRSAEELQSTLLAKQAARDQGVLDGLAHPARTYAYTERGPLLFGKLEQGVLSQRHVALGEEDVELIGAQLPDGTHEGEEDAVVLLCHPPQSPG